MKHLLFMLITTFLFGGCAKIQIENKQTINPLIGDISFETKFGHKPDANTDDQLRIKTHLEYVENLLKNKDASHLPLALQTKRKLMISLLHDYWSKAKFPKNKDYANQRKPCFIDNDGTICAVGYLVEQSTNLEVAISINKQNKYKEIFEMESDVLDHWIASSGLTKEECAMIQPGYSPPASAQALPLDPVYGISTAVISGLNISLSAINSQRNGNKKISNISLLTGTSQILYGAIMYPKDVSNNGFSVTNESTKVASLINIGLGTSTFILSAMNFKDPKKNNKSTGWNFYSYPTLNNNMVCGVRMVKRI
jgi:hypothetical protein